MVPSFNSLLQNRPLFQDICPGSIWTRDNRWLLSRVQQLARPAGGTWAFCPGWRHQPGQNGGLLSRVAFCPGWNHQPGQKAPFLSRLVSPTGTKGLSPPYPLPSPPARAIQLTCFLLFSAWEGGVLAHFFTTFVKIFDSPSIHRR